MRIDPRSNQLDGLTVDSATALPLLNEMGINVDPPF
jgi:hypothetical protein